MNGIGLHVLRTEYLRGDDDLPVCTDLDSDSWDANFLSQLGQEEENSDEEMSDDETPPPPLKVQSFKEAIDSLEDVQRFLESRGYTQEALGIGSSVDKIACLRLRCASQTSLRDYFS